MDVPEKTTATDGQDTLNQPASEPSSSSSSSSNDSPDPPSHISRPDGFQASSKSKTAVATTFKITEPVSANVPQSERYKSSTATTNATGNEEECRVEISGGTTGRFVVSSIPWEIFFNI